MDAGAQLASSFSHFLFSQGYQVLGMALATGPQLILCGDVIIDIPQVNLTNVLEIFPNATKLAIKISQHNW